MRWRSYTAVVLVLVVGGCGRCRSEREPAGDGALHLPVQPRTLMAERRPHEPPALPQHRELVLEDTGQAPRRALRYAPDEGARPLVIAARVDTRQLDAGAWSERLALPEVRYGLSLRRASASDGGLVLDVRGLQATVGEVAAAQRAEVAPVLDEVLARYRAHVERRRASLHVSDRGVITRLVLTPDAAQDARARDIEQEILQLLIEAVVPLPAEPVGPGARWRATTIMRRGAGVVTQRGHYELVAVDHDVLRVRATITQIGEHQLLPDVLLPSPSVAELVALFWQAQGELELSPASLVPVRGALAVELRAHSRLVQPAGVLDHVVESEGTVALNPAE